ncbi:hypothetical protein HMPREF3226_02181 [Prevotella corporis]|uniref:Uncharacterized protein n=1 Tax=Prevotella corporis TaxID=28128 RepID=A0A133PXH7_9BACT|nr:hypothetical protein HMPREF3226_02181 [Prevotella corporis]
MPRGRHYGRQRCKSSKKAINSQSSTLLKRKIVTLRHILVISHT